MAEERKKQTMPDAGMAEDARPVPSQAEGADPDPGLAMDARPVPSQAEGDEETIEEDLRARAA